MTSSRNCSAKSALDAGDFWQLCQRPTCKLAEFAWCLSLTRSRRSYDASSSSSTAKWIRPKSWRSRFGSSSGKTSRRSFRASWDKLSRHARNECPYRESSQRVAISETEFLAGVNAEWSAEEGQIVRDLIAWVRDQKLEDNFKRGGRGVAFIPVMRASLGNYSPMSIRRGDLRIRLGVLVKWLPPFDA